jgi:hypothetical protein
MSIATFWVLTPFGRVGCYQRVGGTVTSNFSFPEVGGEKFLRNVDYSLRSKDGGDTFNRNFPVKHW